MTTATPARRLALLESMLVIRARRETPFGREAVHAGVRMALGSGELLADGSSLPAGDHVSAMFFGDAARLHAIAALAGQQPLPLLCLCDSSPWSTFTSRPGVLGIDSAAVDSHDVEAIHDAAAALAAASARDGLPRLLELLACRQAVDTGGIDLSGVDERGPWAPCDPIALQTARLLGDQIVSPGELMVMHQRAIAAAQARRTSSRANETVCTC
jgi:TPP-dependent pyruvate/acetoin dehydrogenase alpha subunit